MPASKPLTLDPFPPTGTPFFLARRELGVINLGGAGSVNGTFFAAMLLGICDIGSKYYVPEFGAFMIYVLMAVVLLYRPQGLYSLVARRRAA